MVPPENQGRTTYHYILNLSQILDRALSPFGRVLYLSNESTDVFGEYGLIVESTDETWRNVFQICAAQARAVLVAPGDTPGVVRGDAHAVRR